MFASASLEVYAGACRKTGCAPHASANMRTCSSGWYWRDSTLLLPSSGQMVWMERGGTCMLSSRFAARPMTVPQPTPTTAGFCSYMYVSRRCAIA